MQLNSLLVLMHNFTLVNRNPGVSGPLIKLDDDDL